uniref:Uncharacterized protein n=1 Tax=Aegilops tauschii subsp. strangulata TaxID=200361 RepID=A0A453GWM2_AEGTS
CEYPWVLPEPNNGVEVSIYVKEVATLTGHTLRVLYLATSPDGQTIVTGAGDETLRFWNIFPSMKAQAPARDAGLFSFSRSHIR